MMSRYDDIDDPDYQDTNCGPAMAGYMTEDEKEIERLQRRVEELERKSSAYDNMVAVNADCAANDRARIEELERELASVNENWKFDMEARKELERELAEKDKRMDEWADLILISNTKLQRFRKLAEIGQAMPFPCCEVDDDGMAFWVGKEKFEDQDVADNAAYKRYVKWGSSVRDLARELLKEE